MPQRPSRVLRSAELRAIRGKTRASLRGELDSLRAEAVAQEQYLSRVRGLTSLRPRADTFVPTVSFATPGTSSFSYALQVGRYTRFENLVQFYVSLIFTPTVGTGSGAFRVNGLPFGSGNNDGNGYVSYWSGFSWAGIFGETMVAAYVPTGSTRIVFYWLGSTTPVAVEASDLNSGSVHNITIGGTYITDED